MEKVFDIAPATGCGRHEHLPKEAKQFLSCGCGLAELGCYMIVWGGQGLGLVCESKEDGDRKAYMMNVAWDLSKRSTLVEDIRVIDVSDHKYD